MKNYECKKCGFRTIYGGPIPASGTDPAGVVVSVCPECREILTPKVGPIPGRRKPITDRSRPVVVYLSQPFADWLESRVNRRSDVENALQMTFNVLKSRTSGTLTLTLTQQEELEEAFRR